MNNRTVIQYNSRWNHLLQRQNEEYLADRISGAVRKAIEDAKQHVIKPSTYRAYKAAICYGLAETYLQLEKEYIEDVELENGLNVQLLSSLYKEINAEKISFADTHEYKDKTSAKKKKSFPKPFYDYLEQLSNDLAHKNTKRFSLMLSFVHANLIVGLRPIEWLNVRLCTSIKDKCMVLLVENAKNSNGRANGDVREISLHQASQDQERKILSFFVLFQDKLSHLVKQFLVDQSQYERKPDFTTRKQQHVLSHILSDYSPSVMNNLPKADICDKHSVPQNGLAEIVLRSMQNEMYAHFNNFRKISPDVEEKRVSLYSTRHQCIANAKASKVPIFEIAAFFGHSSKETSSRHYGKAWSGWSNFTFKPSIESILAVTGSNSFVAENYPDHIQSTPAARPNDGDLYLGV